MKGHVSPWRVFSTPHGRARIREAVSSPLNLGQSPKSTLRSGGSSRGTTSQKVSALAGVGPIPFLNCLCPLNGVEDINPGTTLDALANGPSVGVSDEVKAGLLLVARSPGPQNKQDTQALGSEMKSHQETSVKLRWGTEMA